MFKIPDLMDAIARASLGQITVTYHRSSAEWNLVYNNRTSLFAYFPGSGTVWWNSALYGEQLPIEQTSAALELTRLIELCKQFGDIVQPYEFNPNRRIVK